MSLAQMQPPYPGSTISQPHSHVKSLWWALSLEPLSGVWRYMAVLKKQV